MRRRTAERLVRKALKEHTLKPSSFSKRELNAMTKVVLGEFIGIADHKTGAYVKPAKRS